MENFSLRQMVCKEGKLEKENYLFWKKILNDGNHIQVSALSRERRTTTMNGFL